jgi:hypothetical protein
VFSADELLVVVVVAVAHIIKLIFVYPPLLFIPLFIPLIIIVAFTVGFTVVNHSVTLLLLFLHLILLLLLLFTFAVTSVS